MPPGRLLVCKVCLGNSAPENPVLTSSATASSRDLGSGGSLRGAGRVLRDAYPEVDSVYRAKGADAKSKKVSGPGSGSRFAQALLLLLLLLRHIMSCVSLLGGNSRAHGLLPPLFPLPPSSV